MMMMMTATDSGDLDSIIAVYRHKDGEDEGETDFWPHNVVKRGTCYERVYSSVCLSVHLMRYA